MFYATTIVKHNFINLRSELFFEVDEKDNLSIFVFINIFQKIYPIIMPHVFYF